MCGRVTHESPEHWSPTNKDESTVVRSLTCYLLEVFFLVCPSIIDIEVYFLQLNVGDIGAIFKIQLYIGGNPIGTPWSLNKVSLVLSLQI